MRAWLYCIWKEPVVYDVIVDSYKRNRLSRDMWLVEDTLIWVSTMVSYKRYDRLSYEQRLWEIKAWF